MALFDSTYDGELPVRVRAVQAGDAAEMVSRLTNALTAAIADGDQEMADFKLAGAGSGPNWEAWFVDGEADVVVALSEAKFAASEAGNPVEATLRLNQQITALFDGLAPDTELHVFKVEVAGAGDGPTYMAVALYAIEAVIQ